MLVAPSLRRALSWTRRRLRERPDSEHEMTWNRLGFAGLVMGYLGLGTVFGIGHASEMLVETAEVFALYLVVSLALFSHILYRPAASPGRRLFAIVHDLAMISYVAEAGGEAVGFFYPLYLWTIFGNGFRFGVPYLRAASLVALAGLAAVLGRTGFLAAHMGVAGMLLLGLVILPLYVSRLIAKLSEAKRQAEEASRAKSLFLASISHELRTPLNAIIGLSDLLREQALEREQAGWVQVIGASGRSLLGLINSLLDFSRLEAGRMPCSRGPFDLLAMLSQIRAMLAVQAGAKGLRLALHVTPRTPRHVVGDLRHLEEVLVNLASNAVKFTQAGHVVIGVDAVAVRGDRTRLRFEVTDTGIGIAPEAQERIFESFTQADDTIIDRFGGTGLGLAIVRQLVELQGGVIGLESRVGEGSTFWFEIEVEAGEGRAEGGASTRIVVALSRDGDVLAHLGALAAEVRPAATAEAAREALIALIESGVTDALCLVDARALTPDGHETGLATFLNGLSRAPAIVWLRDHAETGLLRGAGRALCASVVGRPLDREMLRAALRVAEASAGPVALEAEAPAAAPRRRPLHILVAEDNRTNQMVITKILEQAGHQVTLADDGAAAVDALRAARFDAVLMDVNMPVMNGIEATKLYRLAAIGRERVPIIALTADATPEAQSRCLEAGMDACATKPIEPRRLLDLLDTLAAPGPAADPAAEAGDGRVVALAEPCDVSEAAPGRLNTGTLAELEKLGGRGFVRELVDQFAGDAETILADLRQAAAGGDVALVRDRLHALRSAGANVGAEGVFALCLTWREIGEAEIAGEGGPLPQIETEVTAALQGLRSWGEAA